MGNRDSEDEMIGVQLIPTDTLTPLNRAGFLLPTYLLVGVDRPQSFIIVGGCWELWLHVIHDIVWNVPSQLNFFINGKIKFGPSKEMQNSIAAAYV